MMNGYFLQGCNNNSLASTIPKKITFGGIQYFQIT